MCPSTSICQPPVLDSCDEKSFLIFLSQTKSSCRCKLHSRAFVRVISREVLVHCTRTLRHNQVSLDVKLVTQLLSDNTKLCSSFAFAKINGVKKHLQVHVHQPLLAELSCARSYHEKSIFCKCFEVYTVQLLCTFIHVTEKIIVRTWSPRMAYTHA